MGEDLIARYNACVGKEDTVLWLGDCFFHSVKPKDILDRLNGRKWLLRGNHDRSFTHKRLLESGFEDVFPTHFKSEVAGHPVRFSHYQYDPPKGVSREEDKYRGRRPPREKGVVLIHGHSHEPARLKRGGVIHVGVDAWDYSPVPHWALEKLVQVAVLGL